LNVNKNFLIIQTAFLGDVILTIPLAQEIKRNFTGSHVSFLCIPSTAGILQNHPCIDDVIVYDKRNEDKGIRNFRKLSAKLKGKKFDVLISPHRSSRSSLLSYFTKTPLSISFNKSTFSFLYKTVVDYSKNLHEIQRNLSLLAPLGIISKDIVKPDLYPSDSDKQKVSELLGKFKINEKFVTIAPGSVWFTKTYPEEKFVSLLKLLKEFNVKVVLVGGEDDAGLCSALIYESKNFNVCNSAGKLTPLQSAELIKRSEVLLTNDSAPLHLANAVGTKVIAIFGATVPEFGFYPYGKDDVIMQTEGLKCRPCSIHGGEKCPIKTFICMHKIDEVLLCEEIIKL
jgi:heptosyltransferase II